MDVEGHLRRFRWRLRTRVALRILSRTLPPVLLGTLILAIGAHVILDDARAVALAPILLLLCTLLAVVVTAVRSPSLEQVAIYLDHKLSTREVILAAYEAGPSCAHPLEVVARRQAAAILAGPTAGFAVPLTRPRAWRPALLGLAALVAVPWIPVPRWTAGPRDEAVPKLQAVGETLARKIEPLREEIGELDRPEAGPLVDKLRQIADDLEQGRLQTEEEVLVALARVSRETETYRDRVQASRVSEELADVTEALMSDPFASDVARALRDGEMASLTRSLERMADALPEDELAAEAWRNELERLADNLDRLAGILRDAGHSEAAEVMQELAEAIRAGDMNRARELLRSTEGLAAFRGCAGSGLDSEIAGELLDAIDLARYLLGLGGPPMLEEGMPGEGRPGSHPGDSSTNEAGEAFASGDPSLRDRESEETSDRTGAYESLYESHIIEGESWVDVRARGRLGEQGEFGSREGRSLGVRDGAAHPVPLSPVATPGAPERAAELERIPLGYRDVVRRYFSRDDPEPEEKKEPDGE
jgi:hypothetical protein